MGTVFVSLGISLDGYVAGERRGPANPLGDGGLRLHSWLFEQAAFREHLCLGPGGEVGEENAYVEALFARIGANVMGRRMFDEGEANWPENAPFGAPVFVLTHEARASWPRPNGAIFHFVTEGLAPALRAAREAAGDKDVRVCGGREVVRAALEAGVVDELELAVAPVFLGQGLRLFDPPPQRFSLEPVSAKAFSRVVIERYRVRRA